MLKLDISSIIFIQVLLTAIAIIGLWLFYCYKKSKRLPPDDEDYIWRCSVCFNTYVDSRHDNISTCPLCGSYNKKENRLS